MIFDFGKLKNSISSSCISRKSITSHTKLCNSIRHFYYQLGRAATAMRAQMSKIFGHDTTLKTNRFYSVNEELVLGLKLTGHGHSIAKRVLSVLNLDSWSNHTKATERIANETETRGHGSEKIPAG